VAKKDNKKELKSNEALIEAIKQVNEYREPCEANIVSILYKTPDLIYEVDLKIQDFSNNIWRVYFAIFHGLVVKEKKSVLDDITIGLYLEKHLRLQNSYEKYGGYEIIQRAATYVQVENLSGYTQELNKWKTIMAIAEYGFPIKDKIKDYCDMTTEEIYDEFESFLNHAFINVDSDVKSYNALDGIHDLIDKMNESQGVGMPLYNCHLVNKEIGGLNSNGHIYGLGANSGVGKSTTAINYIIPSIIEHGEKVVFMINEEDETKVQRELLIWVANNVYKAGLPKYVLRDGNFTEETLKLLKKCADWLEDKKEKRNITIIPLEKYSVKIVIKIIKKYSSMGVKYFVLDTLKESCDARDEIYKSMTRDMVTLYDVVKPVGKNVSLFVTYQLGKASIKQRYYTNNEIGLAKSIVDVMSVNLMMRKPFDDEFRGGKREITYYRLEGKNGRSRIPCKLEEGEHYMIMFIPKNRFGASDEYQIVSKYNMSTNLYQDLGICNIPQDW